MENIMSWGCKFFFSFCMLWSHVALQLWAASSSITISESQVFKISITKSHTFEPFLLLRIYRSLCRNSRQKRDMNMKPWHFKNESSFSAICFLSVERSCRNKNLPKTFLTVKCCFFIFPIYKKNELLLLFANLNYWSWAADSQIYNCFVQSKNRRMRS